MKWPFVRRSKHESMIKEQNEQIVNLSKMLKEQNTHQTILEDKIRSKNYENIKLVQKEIRFKRTLENNQEEINRLNQELSNELNSHRDTKECFEYTIEGLRIHNDNLEKELKETKEQKNELSSECDRLYGEVEKLKKETDHLKGKLDGYKELLSERNKEFDELSDKFKRTKELFREVRDEINIIFRKLY